MKKNIFIMIFASVISILSISSVKALNNPVISNDYLFPNQADYIGDNTGFVGLKNILISDRQNDLFKVQCWHTYSTQSDVYCFVGNTSFNPLLVYNYGSYRNNYNTDGFSFDSKNWINYNTKDTYYSESIYKWNKYTYTWDTVCDSYPTNLCDSSGYIVANGNQFPTAIFSGNNNVITIPYFKTDIWYSKLEWESPYFLSDVPQRPFVPYLTFHYFSYDETGRISVNLHNTDSNVYDDLLVFYSYNGTDWHLLSDLNADDTVQVIRVYQNGDVYFRIKNGDVNLNTQIYNVSGLATFNDYSIYDIPSGKHQIYISNFNGETTGTIYLPPDLIGSFTNLVFLDSDSNILSEQYINYSSYFDIGVDTITGDNTGLVAINYDFSDYPDTKVISFSYESEKNLIMWIKNNLYLYWLDLTNPDNYHCDTTSDIDNATVTTLCSPHYIYQDNNLNISADDSSLTTEEIEQESYFHTLLRLVSINIPILIGIGKDFSSFFNYLPDVVRYALYFVVGIFFTYFIIKMLKNG